MCRTDKLGVAAVTGDQVAALLPRHLAAKARTQTTASAKMGPTRTASPDGPARMARTALTAGRAT
eukprot:scaffold15997_cov55-Phaeocystis_antarctica.AAC.1